jgi:hypothetical protein
MATYDSKGRLCFWDMAENEMDFSRTFQEAVTAIAYDLNGGCLFVGTESGFLLAINATTFNEVQRVRLGPEEIRTIIHSEPRTILARNVRNEVFILAADDGLKELNKVHLENSPQTRDIVYRHETN